MNRRNFMAALPFAPFVSIAAATTFTCAGFNFKRTYNVAIDSRDGVLREELEQIVAESNRKMLLMLQDRASRGVGSKGPELFIP